MSTHELPALRVLSISFEPSPLINEFPLLHFPALRKLAIFSDVSRINKNNKQTFSRTLSFPQSFFKYLPKLHTFETDFQVSNNLMDDFHKTIRTLKCTLDTVPQYFCNPPQNKSFESTSMVILFPLFNTQFKFLGRLFSLTLNIQSPTFIPFEIAEIPNLQTLSLVGFPICNWTVTQWQNLFSKLSSFLLDPIFPLTQQHLVQSQDLADPSSKKMISFKSRLFSLWYPKNNPFPNLQHLDLTDANLTVSQTSSIWRLKHLLTLSLASNTISLPNSFAFVSLTKLNLSNCNFTEFPPVLTSCISLEYLDLSWNSLSSLDSPVSTDTCYLTFSHLTHLNLCGNEFSISPKIFKFAPKLSTFDISSNSLDTIDHFLVMPHLIYLNLSNNLLNSYHISPLISSRVLRYLDISFNPFSSFPVTFKNDTILIRYSPSSEIQLIVDSSTTNISQDLIDFPEPFTNF